MKKRVLSALLVLCLACGLVSTAWAADGQATPETAAVSVTDAASGETADAADYPARTVEQTVPGTDVTVQVEVPEGALPEDAELTTALVGSSEDAADDQAVADVANELDKAEVKYDGFVALDVSFVDTDGNKVEPLQPVSVNFTLPAELLPEDVDASTLEVQHLEENAAGEVENVQTVADTADAAEGTVTVDAPAVTLSEDVDTTLPADAQVTAEFTVDGFSTFTLTYRNSLRLSIQVVDTNDNGIGQNGSSTIDTSWKSVQNIADEILEVNQISDKYELDRAEIRSNSKTTEIKWIKYYSSGWSSGFRYSTNSESKPNGYDNGTPLNNSAVYFVFKTKDSQVDPTPGDGDNRPEINFNDLPRNNNSRTSVNFYVNLRSQIANSDGSTTTPETDEFTASVRSTTLSEHPTTFKYTQVGAQYVVLQGATDGSAYAIDQKIRALEGNDGEQGFQIADFPTDDEVFTYLKSLERNDWKNIKVGDTTITWDNRNSELTAEKYAIRWYVFKYDTSDSWHVDGILVPRYGRLTVTKTFTFDQANLTQQQMLELVPDKFTINVYSDQHSYLLQMKQKTDEDDISRPGWDSVSVSKEEDTSSITFTWGLDVLAYTYKIAEDNATVTNYTLASATYSATNYQGNTSTGPIDNGFTVICQTIAEDQEGATAQQQANLTNTYTKSVGSLEITKAIEGLPDNLADMQSFTFTITPSTGLTVNWDTVSATDGSSQPVTITKTEKGAKVTLTGEGTVTIQNLPLGSYTVDEETPQGLSDYSYDRNEFSPQNKTVEVKADQSGKITVTNHYSEYKSLTLKKMVAGNMTVASDTFSFTISGIDTDQVNKQDSSITVEESNGNVIVTMKGDQSVKIEKLTDKDQITITESDSGNGYTPSIDLSDVAGYSNEGNTVSHTGFTTSGTNSVTVDVDKVSTNSSDLGLIVFINTRNIPTPTGLESNHTAPYTILVTVAGIAGLALIGGIVARRRRRRME